MCSCVDLQINSYLCSLVLYPSLFHAANMSDTNTSDTTAVTSPVPRAAKRDNEGNPKDAPTETKAPAAAGAPKPSPTSEVKKQNAAVSLTQLFTTTQDSLTSCESGTNDTLGEAGNFLAECFSGDGDGEHGHLAVDPNAAPVANAEGESNTPTMGNTENSTADAVGGEMPARKKAKGAEGVAVKTEEEEVSEEVSEEVAASGKNQETPLAMKAGAYRLNKLMEVRFVCTSCVRIHLKCAFYFPLMWTNLHLAPTYAFEGHQVHITHS